MKYNAKVLKLLAVMMAFLLGVDSGMLALAQEADSQRHLQIDDYFALKSVGSPHISPDGAWVAYTVQTKDLENDRSEIRLWMVPTAGGEPMPMTAKGSSIWSPSWSPDGKYLTFMASSRGQGSQVFTLDLRGGERVQITSIKEGVEGYEWSPDGKRLVLLIRDPDPNRGEAKGPWVIDRLQFKEDYQGYLNRLRAHLYIYDLETKATVQITSGDYEDYSPAWSPDGSLIAFTSNRTWEPDANYNTDIWLVKPDIPHDRQQPVRVTSNPGADDGPLWHPDGKRIVYSTTTRPDLANYAQFHVVINRIDEDKPVILTECLDRNVFDPLFAKDGSSIYFQLEDDGMVNLGAVSIDDGSVSLPIAGRRAVRGAAAGPNGTIIALVSEPRLPAELFVLDAGPSASSQLRRLTHVNDELLNTIALADAEEARFMSTDGTTEIQAFIYKPLSFDPRHRYPTLLWLHGGQESQYDYGFNFRVQLFAANGYVVVMPNVRGSGGRGLDFALSNWQNWGKYDALDVLAATDHAMKCGYVDPERLGIGGWSYGGCLTNWVITITDRYAGAISGAGNSLWIANYGHDRYQKWYALELGLPWESREVWERASPFNRVQNITTPTLWIGAEKDWNVPVINSEHMYQAMKKLGRETMLVVYPNAHHGIRRHSYHKDLLERFLGWFDKYVKRSKPGS
jgi:dipeptidyl aminopeptidase/acylaminoacyl peptidase